MAIANDLGCVQISVFLVSAQRAFKPGFNPVPARVAHRAVLAGEPGVHFNHTFAQGVRFIDKEQFKLEEGPTVKPLVPIPPLPA